MLGLWGCKMTGTVDPSDLIPLVNMILRSKWKVFANHKGLTFSCLKNMSSRSNCIHYITPISPTVDRCAT